MTSLPTISEAGSLPATRKAPGPDASPAIQVENLSKSFRIPTHRVDTFKERLVRPFSSRDYRELRALDSISFEVRRGEFFGIVGRNGSGKSTLLKILASIYRADAGTIRMAGRLAPFIELGVGFNSELSARENVVLNGVMMGLTPAETRNRLDAVLEFAELRDFVDLKLKNYSSGMLVRLAFSVMLEADADIMLIDEVLAVGDASFQQKCNDAFREMREAGKTIVLVTHEMGAVEEQCDRAMLISDGDIVLLGDPAEVGRRYLRLNFSTGDDLPTANDAGEEDGAHLDDICIQDESGHRLPNLEQDQAFELRARFAATRELKKVSVGFIIADSNGFGVTQFGVPVRDGDDWAEIGAGQYFSVSARLDNPLRPGRYFVHCGVQESHGPVALYAERAFDFVIFGSDSGGAVNLRPEVSSQIEKRPQP